MKAAQDETTAWFRAAQKTVSGNELMARNRPRLLPQRRISQQLLGRMIMYYYDPKFKHKLPYYDTFPLVIPIELYSGSSPGWLGINLHYLPHSLRRDLLDALYSIYNDQHLNETKKLRLSYATLQRTTRIRWYQPAIKRYLSSHLRSKIYVVDPKEWDLTLMLPTERFVGKSAEGVWQQSRRKLGLR
jgi:hypothetical protein